MLVLIFYHVITYALLLYEEFTQWRLTFADREATFWGGGSTEIPLLESLQTKIQEMEEQGSDREKHKDELIKILSAYKNHFKAFSRVACVRFLMVEVGIPLVAMVFSILTLLNILNIDGVRTFAATLLH